MSGELTGKRLGLLAQLPPPGTPVGFLTNKKGVQSSLHANDFELAVAAMGRESVVVGASDDVEIDNSFTMLTQKKVGGLVVENDPFFDCAPYSVNSTALDSGDLSHSRISPGRRSDELWDEPGGCVQPNGGSRRTHPQGRQHRGLACHAPDKIRAGSQSGHRESIGTHHPANCAGNC